MHAFIVLVAAAVLVTCWVHPASGHRIVAIGDLHGDIENAELLLRQAKLVDERGEWIAGGDTLVQMGDMLDRGPHGVAIMDLFDRVAESATRAGGEVVQLLGNHELMNLQGDRKFVAAQLVNAVGGLERWRDAFSPSGEVGRRLLDKPVLVVRNHTLFVHAGILALDAKRPFDEINHQIVELLRARQFQHPLLLNDGPLWTRTLIYSAQKGDCRPVHNSLSAMNTARAARGETTIRRIVIGHTIQPQGVMRAFCNNTLHAIDMCVSQYMPNCGFQGHWELRESPDGHGSSWFVYPDVHNAKHPLHWQPELHLNRSRAEQRVHGGSFNTAGVVGGKPGAPAKKAPPRAAWKWALLALTVGLALRLAWTCRARQSERSKKDDSVIGM